MSKNFKLGTIARVNHKGGTIKDGSIIKCIEVCNDKSHGWKVLDGYTRYCTHSEEGPSAYMSEEFVEVLYTPEPERKPEVRHFNSITGMEYEIFMTEADAIQECRRMVMKHGGDWVYFPIHSVWQVCEINRYRSILKDGITIKES